MGVHIPTKHAFFEYNPGEKEGIWRLVYTFAKLVLLKLDVHVSRAVCENILP